MHRWCSRPLVAARRGDVTAPGPVGLFRPSDKPNHRCYARSMAKRDRKKKSAVAAEAWREIFDFIVATGGHRDAVLARLGLTPNDSRALASLDARTGRTMRELARQWECDASTATWIVDRLETKGLAERHAHETDRRVKLVVLTERGESTKA